MTTARFLRSRLYLALAIVFCALVPTSTLTIYYVQTQGMCLKAGRVLSADELRQAVLMDLVVNEIEDLFAYNWREGGDYFLVGINSPVQETDIQKIINTSFNNGKSLEENFGLKIILKGRKKENYTSHDMIEPFTLMAYSLYGGDATVYLSSDVQEMAFAKLDAGSQSDVPRKITAYRRLLGYGNHYFDIPSFSFDRKCCDNRDQNDKDYMEEKQQAYDLAIETFRKMATIEDYPPKFYAIVSNCGDILRTRHGNIRVLGSDFEDGEMH
ncbi:MAG: hypothetical protein LBK55_04240 [Azoarcus sp.]|jgi:hypothetical protein|nr:hypothetical protein [Azoarcus sp.]